MRLTSSLRTRVLTGLALCAATTLPDAPDVMRSASAQAVVAQEPAAGNGEGQPPEAEGGRQGNGRRRGGGGGGQDGGGGGPGGGGRGPGGGGRRGGFGASLLRVVTSEENAAVLSLSAEQTTALTELNEAQRAGFGGGGMRNMFSQDMTEEQRTKAMAEMQAMIEKNTTEAEEKVASILSPAQMATATNLYLKTAGPAGLARPFAAKTLGLSDDQVTQIKAVQAASMGQFRQMFQASPEERQKMQDDLKKSYMDVLSSDQQTKFVGLTTEVADATPATGTPATTVAANTPAAETATPAATAPTAETQATEKPSESMPAAADATAKPASDAPAATATVPAPATTAAAVTTTPAANPDAIADFGTSREPGAARGDKPFSFNFRFAPWELVLKRFAEEADLTLDMTVVPPGTFNYLDRRSFSPTEALDILNGYLLQKGFVLVRRDRFLVVLNIDAGIPPNLVPKITPDELDSRGNNELLTVVFQLNQGDPTTIAEELKQLLGPQSKAVALTRSNRVMLTDIGSNLKRVKALLEEDAGKLDGKTLVFRSFQLKHISATEADRTLRDLFNLAPRASLAARMRGTVTTSAPATPAAAPATPAPQNNNEGGGGGRGGRGRFGGGGPGGMRFEMMGMGSPDAMPAMGPPPGGAAPGGQPPATPAATPAAPAAPEPKKEIQIAVDLRSGSLLVTATASDMELIEKALETIDVDPETAARKMPKASNMPQLEVYPLRNADPITVIDTISILVPGLTITEDVKSRRINVYASPNEQSQVRAIVRQLDGETSDSVTVIPLKKLDAAAAANSLKSLFKTSSDAPNIEADVLGQRIMVRGTPDQVQQLRSLLAQLGEDGKVEAVGNYDRGPIRALGVGGRDPVEVAEMIRRLWPEDEQADIRVVVPNEESSSRRKGMIDERIPSGRPPSGLPGMLRGTPPELPSAGAGSRRPARKAPALPTPSAAREPARKSSIPLAKIRFASGNPDPEPTAGETPAAAAAEPTGPVAGEAAESTSTAPKDAAGSSTEETASKAEGAKPDSTVDQPAGEQPAGEHGVGEEPAPVTTDNDETASPVETESPVADKAAGSAESANQSGSSKQRVVLTPDGDQLIISGENSEKLDQIEALVKALTRGTPGGQSKWTVFYLRSADCTETATILSNLFPQGSVSQSTTESRSGFFGSLTSGMSSLGSSVMDATGLNSLGEKDQKLRIVPEPRSNALFVTGPADQIKQVEQMLKVLDSVEIPESLKDRTPRIIPVEYADATEVSDVLSDVFKEQLEDPNANQNQQQGRGGNPFAMMFGAPQGNGKQKTLQLTVGVDTTANSLIVSCNESLFRQVEGVVQALDTSAKEANRGIRIMRLQNANPAVIEQALGAFSGKVKVGITSPQPTNNNTGGQQFGGNPFGGFGGGPFGGGFRPGGFGTGQFGGGQFGGNNGGQNGGNRGGGNTRGGRGQTGNQQGFGGGPFGGGPFGGGQFGGNNGGGNNGGRGNRAGRGGQ